MPEEVFYIMKHTLKLNKDFRRLYSRGKSCASGCVVVYCLKNRKGTNRIGLTVGKSVGKAVKRNRAKRLMRESCRLISADMISGFDIIVVARIRINGKKCGDVHNDLKAALEMLGLLK